MLTLSRDQPAKPTPAKLRATRDAFYRDAWDHADLAEYQAAITEASALVVRLRQMAATCERPKPLLAFADAIEDAAFPLEQEAWRWDDARAARQAGNRLDTSRVWRPEDLGETK